MELIGRHKDIVRHLRGNGIDGFEIKKILDNDQGRMLNLMRYAVLSPTKRDIAKQHKIDYARRHIMALVNNKAISDEEREYLFNIDRRLSSESLPFEKDKSGQWMAKMKGREGDAKSDKQATGRQVVNLHSYMMKFNTMPYPQTAIFDLIAELFGEKYTRTQIKNFYTNNF